MNAKWIPAVVLAVSLSASAAPLWQQMKPTDGTTTPTAKMAAEEQAARAKFADYDHYRQAVIEHLLAQPSMSVEEAYCVAVLKDRVEQACTPVYASLRECGPGRERCSLGALLKRRWMAKHGLATPDGATGIPPQTVHGTPHTDSFGRPVYYETTDGSPVYGDVKPNAYGLGVHMDQYGRPVRARDAFGNEVSPIFLNH